MNQKCDCSIAMTGEHKWDCEYRPTGKLAPRFDKEAETLGAGRKDDLGKLQYSLIPAVVTTSLARVLTYGAKKYAPNNWQNVQPFRERYTDALLRHLEAWRGGEDVDPESGFLHLEHVLCNAAFLCWDAVVRPRNADAGHRG